MAKKAPVVANWSARWGEDNFLQMPLEDLTELTLSDGVGEWLVNITPDEDGGAQVQIGALVIQIRRPTTAEKRKGWETLVTEVTEGLDNDYVLLGPDCGAIVPTDEGSDEAE